MMIMSEGGRVEPPKTNSDSQHHCQSRAPPKRTGRLTNNNFTVGSCAFRCLRTLGQLATLHEQSVVCEPPNRRTTDTH
jgi:hypothetical protein